MESDLNPVLLYDIVRHCIERGNREGVSRERMRGILLAVDSLILDLFEHGSIDAEEESCVSAIQEAIEMAEKFDVEMPGIALVRRKGDEIWVAH